MNRNQLPRTLHAASMFQLIAYLNSMRIASGLPAKKSFPGTSKQAVIITINRAERNEFPDSAIPA